MTIRAQTYGEGTNGRPPLTMTDREMHELMPGLAAKTVIVLVLHNVIYVKHCGDWVLLDAERHGYPSFRD